MLAIAAPTDSFAIWEKYSPFSAGASPKRFPQTHLVATRVPTAGQEAPVDISFSRPESSAEIARLSWLDDKGYRLTIGPHLSPTPFQVPVAGSPICDSEASLADLNRDGVPDFIVVTHSGGNGLAAQITYVTFVLSSPAGHVGHTLLSFDATPGDLFDLNGDGRPEFVHAMSVRGDVGKDGKAHNYWVYNLLAFSGTTIVSANRTDSRFPKWIMFSHEANHTATRQLTAEQRERQWILAWKWEAQRDRESPVIPIMLGLAMEQRKEAH